MSDNNLSKNIFLQAKRASKLLDCSLTKSKNFIAKAIYQCHDYDDLCSKLENNSLKATVYPFCKVHPNSDYKLQSYLKNNIGVLSERISLFMSESVSPTSVFDLTWKLFGFPRNFSISQVHPHFSLDNLHPYDTVESDADSVLYCDFKINGVPFKILAIKLVTPNMFYDKSLNEVLRKTISNYRFPLIMWNKWDVKQAGLHSFAGSDELDKAFFKTGLKKTFNPKTINQKVLQDMIYESMTALADEFIGTSIRHCCSKRDILYIVGFPMFNEPKLNNCPEFYITNSHIYNGKCLFGFGENIIALELFEVNTDGDYIGDAEVYYNAFSCALLQFDEALRQNIVIDGKRYEAYLRPCTHAEYSLYRNSAVIIDGRFPEKQRIKNPE